MATEAIYNKTILFDANLMSVVNSVGMTNSGTSGWISSSGRFYPTISGRWLISLAISWRPNSSPYVDLVINRRNGTTDAVIESRIWVSGFDNALIYTHTYSSIFYCNVGEYLNITKNNSTHYGLIYYDGLNKTHASFAFMM